MMDARTELRRLIGLSSHGDGSHESPVPGIRCIKISGTGNRNRQHWGAWLCIVAQGGKEIVVGRDLYQFDDATYVVTPIDLPVISRITTASPEKPFLCLTIDLDPMTLFDVAAQFEWDTPAGETEHPLQAVFVGKTSDTMLDAAVRLGRLFQTPEDAPVLGPLVIKELLYHILKGPDGPAIRQFVRSGSTLHKISAAIHRLRADLGDDVGVTALSKEANMSRSAFFKHFKELTAMSPIQYQKHLRLLEARRLMIEAGETAEGSAFKVGYRSASQFSREYSRMFGNSPLRDAVNIRRNESLLHQV